MIEEFAQFLSILFANTDEQDELRIYAGDGFELALTTASPNEISAQFENVPSSLLSLQTSSGAVVGVARPYEGTWTGLPPSVRLMKAGVKQVGFWLLDVPVTGAVLDDVGRLQRVNYALNGDVPLDDPCPVAGYAGWKLIGGDQVRYYTLDELAEAFEAMAASPLHKINDALVYGEISREIMDHKFPLALSPKGLKTTPGTWKNIDTSVAGLLKTITHHRVGDKDGQCILQGSVLGGERKAHAMRECSLLMLDLDTGERLEDLKAKIAERGWFTVVWTTYSHLKPITEIKKDQVIKWMKREEEPTLSDVVGYLTTVKRYRSWVLEGAELLEQEHTKDGVMLRIRHQPMPKYRLLFVLREPFVFAKRHTNPAKAVQEWKERYAGVSELLGAAYDRSCVDPSRLMFTPRHPGGAKECFIEVLPGDFLDIDDVPRVDPKKLKDGAADAFERVAAEFGAKVGGKEGAEFQTEGLKRFLAQHSSLFDVEEFFRAYGETRKSRTGAGCHFKCPNDAAHSNAEDSDDNGFFVVSALDTDSGTWVAKCMHDSCAELDRAQLLDKFLVDEGLTVEDLLAYVPELADEKPASKVQTDAAGGSVQSGDDVEKRFPFFALNVAKRERTYMTESLYPADTFRTLKQMNKEYGLAFIGSDVRIIREPLVVGSRPSLVKMEAFKTWFANRRVQIKDKDGETRAEYLSKVWLEWSERDQYARGIMFEPGVEVRDAYNLFKGFPYRPVQGDWSLLRDHVRDEICEGNVEYFHWLMAWCAQIFQQPNVKMGSAVVVRGKKGAGKSTFFDFLSMALGSHAAKVSQRSHIVGQFNAHHQGLVLLQCEEAFWAGDAAAGGVLKDLITSDRMMLEQKGVDVIQTSNYVRLAMVSNEDWVVPASMEDERRFFVLECGTKRLGDIAFFKRVREQMRPLEEGGEGGLNAMVYDLMTFDPGPLGWDILRRPPKTDALRKQAMESLDSWARVLIQAVEDGGFDPMSNPDVLGIELNENEENIIPLKTFRDQLLARVGKFGSSSAKHKSLDNSLPLKLAQDWLFCEGTSRVRRTAYGTERVYVCPPLKVIRQKLLDTKGIEIEVPLELEETP